MPHNSYFNPISSVNNAGNPYRNTPIGPIRPSKNLAHAIEVTQKHSEEPFPSVSVSRPSSPLTLPPMPTKPPRRLLASGAPVTIGAVHSLTRRRKNMRKSRKSKKSRKNRNSRSSRR